jgi:SAM-dependent methyltransferase
MRKLHKAVLGVVGWEAAWWARRSLNRVGTYDEALRLARSLGKPLVVVGAPDRGATPGPGEGDLVIDIGPSRARNFLQADICKRLPLDDNCCVVFVSCVLEYVDDVQAAVAELQRISGGLLYVVRVEPWTLTAYLYPGAKRTVPPMAPSLQIQAKYAALLGK